MRKTLVTFVCIVIVAMFMGSSALADAIAPLSVSQARAFASISISGGNVKAVASVIKLSQDYTVSTSVSLQKQVNSTWKNEVSAAGTRNASASASAIKGVTYRAYAICKIYDSSGNLIETLTPVSETRTY